MSQIADSMENKTTHLASKVFNLPIQGIYLDIL